MALTSVFKPENSIIAGIATMGVVYGTYQLDVGSVAVAHATDPNNGALTSARKKAGWTSLILVAGITLLARDATIAILGGFTIAAMELHYRHAIMASPQTGQVIAPGPAAYQPAQAVVPPGQQGTQPGAGYG